MSRSPRRSRNSITEAWGNFGGPPQPVFSTSNTSRSRSTAASRAEASNGCPLGVSAAPARRRSTILGAFASISSRRDSQVSATASQTMRQLGMPCRGAGGK
jgi:hypothetical protein